MTCEEDLISLHKHEEVNQGGKKTAAADDDDDEHAANNNNLLGQLTLPYNHTIYLNSTSRSRYVSLNSCSKVSSSKLLFLSLPPLDHRHC